MKFLPTKISDVVVVELDVFRDERGLFVEFYHAEKFAKGGIAASFVQDNQSRSFRGTLRGLHAQDRRPQGKLVRTLSGEIFDVAVDIRRGSKTFGRWVGVTLAADDFRALWIPPGFAHGFCVLSEVADVEYKCTDVYDAEGQLSIAWNDPDVGVIWPIADPVLSPKDAAAPLLREVEGRLA
ncbi:MAG: dTDP-4-dehydrorhamnose 3,5-epimerase [Candidatus Binatia bacterium]